MLIPARFKLLGQTIYVYFLPDVFTDHDGHFGFSSYRKNQIHLRPSTSVLPLSNEQTEQTFWHELTHFVLYHAGAAYSGKKDYMHQDEEFVDLVASLYHQAISTFEFEPIQPPEA